MLALAQSANVANTLGAILETVDDVNLYGSDAAILVIEDDQTTLLALSELLYKQGFEVAVAMSGEQARALFDQHFDVILLDLGLPDCTAEQLLGEIKQQPSLQHCAVICLTASSSLRDISAMYAAGASDYVIKPYSPTMLLGKINQLCAFVSKIVEPERDDELLGNIDPLTGLANRLAFELAIVPLWQRQAQLHAPLSVLLIDIDDFSQVNQALGYPQGDDCIVKVANEIKANASHRGEFAARFGGDEFVLVLPNVALERAVTVAEKIRMAIGARCAHCTSRTDHCAVLSVSIGCATIVPDMQSDYWTLLEQADLCLKNAKRAGERNRVYFSTCVD